MLQFISKKREVQRRGPSSSADQNAQVEEAIYDVTQCFQTLVNHEATIGANMEIIMRENFFLAERLIKAEARITELEAALASSSAKKLLASMHQVGDISFALGANFTDITSQADIDTVLGLASIPTQQEINKLCLYKDAETVVPTTLDVKVYEDTSPIVDFTTPVLDNDESVKLAFNGKSNSRWVRVAERGTASSTLYSVLEIGIPQNIINHTYANTLTLVPCPDGSFSITDIQYYNGSEWRTLSTYPKVNGLPKELAEASKLKFVFPRVEITKLRVFIKQAHSFTEGTGKVFVYGFQDIGLYYSSFKKDPHKLLVKFAIPDNTKTFKSVSAISVNLAPGSLTDAGLVTTRLWSGTPYEPRTLGATLSAGTTEVYVEVTINPNVDGLTPLVQSVGIDYTIN